MMSLKTFFLKNKTLVFALIFSGILKTLSFFPGFIENYYIPYLYRPVSAFQRIVFGWLPFSLGDIIYFTAIVYFLYFIYWNIKQILTGKSTREKNLLLFKKVFTFFLFAYILFNVLWGLNYSRKGIAYQLGLKIEKYRKTDIQNLTAAIVANLNRCADSIPDESLFLESGKANADQCYSEAAGLYPFLLYSNCSVKETLFGRMENYMGFQGYYNPFTGEAQINKTVPAFMVPNIIVHEMAHQLGYAKEDEANFVGFLAARRSSNNYFKYSAYFELFQYAAMELRQIDSGALQPFLKILHPKLIRHLNQWKQFRKDHNSFLSDGISWIFNYYLKATDRPQGIATYNEVLTLLVAYTRKYGLESL